MCSPSYHSSTHFYPSAQISLYSNDHSSRIHIYIKHINFNKKNIITRKRRFVIRAYQAGNSHTHLLPALHAADCSHPTHSHSDSTRTDSPLCSHGLFSVRYSYFFLFVSLLLYSLNSTLYSSFSYSGENYPLYYSAAYFEPVRGESRA